MTKLRNNILHSQATGTGVAGNSGTKQLWHHALLYMQRAAGVASQSIHSRAIAPIDEVLLAVLENANRGPVDIILSDGTGRRNIKRKCHFISWQSCVVSIDITVR